MAENTTTEQSVTEKDLAQVLRELQPYRGFIGMVAIALALIGLIYTFLVPPRWQVKATLLLPDQSAASGAGGAAALMLGVSNTAHPLDVLKGVMTSQTALVTIGKKTSLTVKKLEKSLEVTVDKVKNQLAVTVELYDSSRALKVAQKAIGVTEMMTRDLNFTRSRRQATLLQATVAKLTGDLKAAENRLLLYQQGMKTAADPQNAMSPAAYTRQLRESEFALGQTREELALAREQAHQTASQSIDLPTGLPIAKNWRDKLIQLEYDLSVAQVSLGPTAPRVVKLKRETEIARSQLQSEIAKYLQAIDMSADARIADLEAKRVLLEWQTEYAREMAAKAPGEAVSLARLMREVATLSAVLETVRQEYERTRIEAETDRIRFTILDAPYLVPDNPVNKRYVRNTLLAGFFGLLIGMSVAYGKAMGWGKKTTLGTPASKSARNA